ncbi:hypothetical protein DP939_19190 [Spongiactinospora rosea]|uniref:SGNH hydrolase-type esterase domain-containing protein n=2 Tax=Spongiactinospora rosea TaxID=2248750 RepID=A0A366LXD4_9ACTN|nr:hypothetical protein DP939_19190 [Spongiactinospora rosea]
MLTGVAVPGHAQARPSLNPCEAPAGATALPAGVLPPVTGQKSAIRLVCAADAPADLAALTTADDDVVVTFEVAGANRAHLEEEAAKIRRAQENGQSLGDYIISSVESHKLGVYHPSTAGFGFNGSVRVIDNGLALVIPADQVGTDANWWQKLAAFWVAFAAGVLMASLCLLTFGATVPPAAGPICGAFGGFTKGLTSELMFAYFDNRQFDKDVWTEAFAVALSYAVEGALLGSLLGWVEVYGSTLLTRIADAVRATGGWIGKSFVEALIYVGVGVVAVGVRVARKLKDLLEGVGARDELRKRDLKIMPLGDSITYGIGSSTQSSYRADLWRKLNEETAAETKAKVAAAQRVDFVGSQQSGQLPDRDNEGHSGAMIGQIAQWADDAVPAWRPNLVLVHAGTNDMDRGDAGAAPAALGSLIDEVLKDAPKAAVVVATLVPSKTPAVNARITTFNGRVRDLVAERARAGRHVVLADMSAVTPADLVDSLHPNDNGYRKMADAFYDGLLEVAENGWISDVEKVTCDDTRGRWIARGQIASGTREAKDEFVTFADMDGDKRDDYLKVDMKTGAVQAWLNRDQDGKPGWHPRGQIASGTSPGQDEFIRFADIDGDGRDDYLLVNSDNGSVKAWLNKGGDVDGRPGWEPRGQIASGTPGKGRLVFADVDGDKRADYLRVDIDTGAVHAWLNKGGDAGGAPGWVDRGQIAAGGVLEDGDYVEFADVDDDAKADYLTVNGETGAVKAWLNKGGDADGEPGWQPRGQIASGIEKGEGQERAFADLDGDGRDDYLVYGLKGGRAQAFLNRGGDSGGEPGWKSLGQIVDRLDEEYVTFADIDGDKRDDYLKVDQATGAVQAWLNRGGDADGKPGWHHRGQIASGTSRGEEEYIRFADIDGDGRDDYLVVTNGNGSVKAWLNRGGDADGKPGWEPRGQIASGTPGSGMPVFADVNGDKRDDYLRVDQQTGAVHAWINSGGDQDGKPGWIDRGQIAAGVGHGDLESIELANVDCDARADYLVANVRTKAVRAWLNRGGDQDGKPGWVERGQIASGVDVGEGKLLTFADMDGDGRDDYLVLDFDKGSVQAWINKGGDPA